MTKPVKLIAIGNSTGAIFPKDILARLRVEQGDTLYVSEGPDGSIRLTPFDPEFEKQMKLGEDIMREDRDILRALSEMSDWAWIGLAVVNALHERQLAEHGGPAGVRDSGALESALARPINLAAYGEPDAAALAASYAFGLARNHAFVDGNKRTAWVVARLFLKANSVDLQFDKGDALRTVLALAAGELSEDELADWFRERIATR